MYKIRAIMFHTHKWSEWQESPLNKNVWAHEKDIYRFCSECGERENKILTIDCTQFKRTGKWCIHCAPIAEEIERGLDKTAYQCYHENMEKRQNKLGLKYQEPLTNRNQNIYKLVTEKGMSYQAIGGKYGITRARAYQIYKREKEKQAI